MRTRRVMSVIAVTLMAVLPVMASPSLTLTSHGSNIVYLDDVLYPPPTTVSAEVWLVGADAISFAFDLQADGYWASDDGTPYFQVTTTIPDNVNWNTTPGQFATVMNDLLDPAAGTTSALSNTPPFIVTQPRKVANVAITILAAVPPGTYMIDLINVSMRDSEGNSWPGEFGALDPAPAGLTIYTGIPEPTSALLLLAGLPFLRRRCAT